MKTKNGNKKFIITGGGTGGHIFPAIAIANSIKRKWEDASILFVGAQGKMEMKLVPEAGFEIVGLDIMGFDRKHLLKNWELPFKMLKSRKEAKNIIKSFQPDMVIGVGGYASFPLMARAQMLHIPTLIQEQNSYPGRVNKMMGKGAAAICVAYPGMDMYFPKEKLHITGNPVRHHIAYSEVSKEEGLKSFGLNSDKKTLLVVGGSQGARSINHAIKNHLKVIDDLGLQLIWQTGKGFITEAKNYERDGFCITEFISNMEYAYAAADIIISRAGALASAELCIAGKPVVFVPFPAAAEDHQTKNAMALVERNAALMVKDNEVEVMLMEKLKTIIKDEQMQQIMSDELKSMAIKDADDRIVQIIDEVLKS